MSDERIKRSAGAGREDRAMEDRAVTEDREFNEADRHAMLRASLHQDHLPNLPEIPGYHVCWLTTNNPQDSIQSRMARGYELIKASDIKGYDTSSIKSGEYQGFIGVNEMVASKIRLDLYRADMRFFHHIRPKEEEDRLQAPLEAIRQEAKKRGLRIAEGDAADEGW